MAMKGPTARVVCDDAQNGIRVTRDNELMEVDPGVHVGMCELSSL